MATTYQHHVSELKHSSQLPKAIEELNAYWKDEQARRQKFLEEMDEEKKAEFIEGEIVLHSPAKEKHNAVVADLNFLLQAFVQPRGMGIVRIEKAMLHLIRNNFEPDIVFWASGKLAGIEANTMLYPAPDWVCEVLSTSTSKRDRGVKLADYAANSVAEYWIVDPDKKQVEQYLLRKGEYELVLKSGSGIIESEAIAGMSFNVAAVFDVNERILAIQQFLKKA